IYRLIVIPAGITRSVCGSRRNIRLCHSECFEGAGAAKRLYVACETVIFIHCLFSSQSLHKGTSSSEPFRGGNGPAGPQVELQVPNRECRRLVTAQAGLRHQAFDGWGLASRIREQGGREVDEVLEIFRPPVLLTQT